MSFFDFIIKIDYRVVANKIFMTSETYFYKSVFDNY